jgi:hypothetical protein
MTDDEGRHMHDHVTQDLRAARAAKLEAEHAELKSYLATWVDERRKADSNAAACFALLETAIDLAVTDLGKGYAQELVLYTFDRVTNHPKPKPPRHLS